MKSILFVCLGNICRSPMAEAVMHHLVKEAGCADDYFIASAAVSEEEWGNPIYPPAARILRTNGIPYDTVRTARKMSAEDYDRYDLIIGMDEANLQAIRLMDYAGCHRPVADPWYTRDFDTAYNDILSGCRALLEHLSS